MLFNTKIYKTGNLYITSMKDALFILISNTSVKNQILVINLIKNTLRCSNLSILESDIKLNE